MKTKVIYMAAAGICCALTAAAQVKTQDGRIEAHDIAVYYGNGRVTVSMQLDAGKAALHRTEAIVLTPMIRAAGNEQALMPVVIGGGNRMKSDRRAAHFHRSLPYDQASAQAPGMIPYNASAAYEPWMSGATLVLREDLYDCALQYVSGGSAVLMALRPAEPVKPVIAPAVTYITPATEAVKNRNVSGIAYLDFQVGKSVILTDFRNNFRELSRIRTMIDELHGDKDVTTDSIALRGYASPEGSYAANKRLSQQRAEALRSYLQKEYSYPASMFSVSSAGEDWDGLKALVKKSDMADREALLPVIDSNAGPDARERKLKALPGYQELLKNEFPKLRRVEYRLDYTVRAFSVEEGKEKIRTNPGQMSLNEMFLVANTYLKGSDEFKQVFDVAVRMYPADTIANLNEGAMLLERGDAATARHYLEPYASNPGAWNNLGVMYLLDGDYTQARTFFNKAAGTPEAARNLESLSRLEEYQKAKAVWDAYPK